MGKFRLSVFKLALLSVISINSYAQLTVTSPVTNAQIISNLEGTGVTISNLTINCQPIAYGTFNGSTSNIGIANGLIMTTGHAVNAIGPNSATGESGFSNNPYSDPDLLSLEPLADNDVCIIEFDITPACNQLNLNYVFASEEYPEFVCASFDDVFGFFITGPNPSGGNYTSQNIATIPNTTLPVAINSVNPGVNTGGGSCISLNYSQYYVNNANGATIEYDGFTTPLTAAVNVVPCATYHMKLGIADAGDNSYDSGVFLTYQGLTCNPSPLVVTPTQNICAGQSVTLTASGAVSYTWSPTTNLVYVNDSTVIVSPTVTTVYTVTGNNSAGCGMSSGAITVNVGQLDPPSLVISDATCVCDGRATVIPAPTQAGGTPPFTFIWSDGQTTNPATDLCPGQYTVTIIDSAGCSGSVDATIGVTGGPVSTLSKEDVLCFGTSTGSAVVTPTSGTAPYSYSWSNGVQDSLATGLAAGSYDILVTDINGCQSLSTVTITEPALLAITPSQVDVTCKDGNNGSATASVSGGVGPYLYSWSNGATTATASNLIAGSYSVTVTDINGCVSTENFTITEPLFGMSITSTTDSVSCPGGSDGAAFTEVTGGTAPYTYEWVPTGGTNDTATGLSAGMYMVIATDAVGCEIRDTVTIEEPTPLTVSYDVTSTLCAGSSEGTAVATVSGGTPGYVLSWETGGATLGSVASGYYELTVTDAVGCVLVDSVFIPEPTPLSLSMTGTSSTCADPLSGSAQVTATGGTPGYTYSWTSGETSQSLQGIGAGEYIAVVTDANGCQSQDTINISVSSNIIVSFIDQDPTCSDSQDGSIDAIVNGGIGPFTYEWSNGATTSSITNLGAGTYTVEVTDLGADSPVKVYEEDFDKNVNWLLNVSTGSNTDTSNVWYNNDVASGVTGTCNNPGVGDSTLFIGTADQLITGAVYDTSVTTNISAVSPMITTVGYGSPLTLTFDYKGGGDALDKASVDVSVDGGQNWINLQTGLTTAACGTTTEWQSGSFTLPATAENNAQVQLRFVWTNNNDQNTGSTSVAINNVLVSSERAPGLCRTQASNTLTAPSPISVTTNTTPAICTTQGSIEAIPTGGTGAYTYSWGTTPVQTTQTATGLSGNTPYMLTVTDANGCTHDTVLQTTQENGEITATVATIQPATCLSASGIAMATVTSGNTGLQYLWTPGNQTGSTATGLIGGSTYQVTITDDNGCQFQGSITIGVTNIDLAPTTSTTDNICGQEIGTAKATPTTGTGPYTWSWDAATGNQTTETATALDGGSYGVVVTDANGCEGTATVTVNEVLGVNASFTASTLEGIAPASVTFNNTSTGASSYLWDFGNGETSTELSPGVEYQAGEFTVVLHAYAGTGTECEDTATVRIIILDKLELYIPNVFTPNSSNVQNRTFKVTGRGVVEYQATIFDRWGKKVFESTNMTEEWNGDGSSAGTYYYIIDVKGTDQKDLPSYTGFITLIK